MKITCQSCGAKYSIADEKVRGRKVKVRCKSCSTAMVVDGTVPEEDFSDPVDDDEATRIVDTRSTFGLSEPAPAGEAWSVNLSDTDQRSMTTDEIVAGYHAGELGQDAYVWREGMDDWLPVGDVPELAAALGGAPAAPAPAFAARAPAFAAPAPAYAATEPAMPAFGAAAPAARISGGRAAGAADLFGDVDSAGAESDAPGASSSGMMPGAHGYDDKPTGARNENSVLFSLDALKAGFSGNAAAPNRPPPPRSAAPAGNANFDDFMNMGGGNSNALFGLSANQALLTAPAPPEPEPPPPPPSVPPPWQAASVAPSASPKNKLFIAIGGGLAVLAVLGVALAFAFGGKKPEPVAKNDVTAAADKHGDKKDDSKAADDKKDDSKAADDKAADDKKDDSKAADDKAAGDAKPGDTAPATEEEKKRYFEAQKKKQEEDKTAGKDTAKKDTAAKDDKPTVKDTPSSGLASFDKGAAISALSSAASGATGCKRPDGPTGGGRAIVTFAPSGRVTSANVSGGAFGGTSVGGCIASVFRRTHVPPFSGGSVTVSKSFNIP